jgi:protein SCO1/2
MRVRVAAFIVVLAALTPSASRAQDLGPAPGERVGAGVPAQAGMPELLQEVGLDQKLNAQLPLNLAFKDESGRTVKLGDFFGKRPVILTLNYFECPMLCTEVLNGLTGALSTLNFSIGKDFDVVTVSFDPRDTPERASAKKANYVRRYRRDGAAEGWHFLTGNEPEISMLTRVVGFRYAYNKAVGQYAHASGIIVATPDGRLSHYFYGIEYGPRDLRLALIEAADRKIGSPADQLLLACFHYDPSSGKYSLAVMRLIRTAGVATLLVIGVAVVMMRRRERSGPLPSDAGL